jgi:hypothetical protein
LDTSRTLDPNKVQTAVDATAPRYGDGYAIEVVTKRAFVEASEGRGISRRIPARRCFGEYCIQPALVEGEPILGTGPLAQQLDDPPPLGVGAEGHIGAA